MPTIEPKIGGGGGGSTSPGGSTGDIQYNNAGAFGGFWDYDSANDKIIVPTGGSTSHPKIAFGDGDSGFYEIVANTIDLVSGGTARARISSLGLTGTSGDSFRLNNATATATFANINPRRDDANTGLGSAALDQLSLIQGGIEGLRLSEASSHVIQKAETHAGITASTTQTQGNGVLLSTYNQIGTVANANDTVTLTAAAIGVLQTVTNNGANTLQIFPASGDNLGAGVGTATTLAVGNTLRFHAYDSINWNII